jgi:L-seryl-tRNA(Ser) seleniumtransferase
VIDDVGSGVLADGLELLIEEPAVRRSVAAGAALVCFSGDKLLGGPQAGLIVGRREAVEAAKGHPLARAVRIDKLSLAALEATLALYRDPEHAIREIPVLAMLTAPQEELQRRAQALAEATGGELVESSARVGGGALPVLELPGPAVALAGDAQTVARSLRLGEPAVVGRIQRDRLLLDPRTLTDDEVGEVGRAVRELAGE